MMVVLCYMTNMTIRKKETRKADTGQYDKNGPYIDNELCDGYFYKKKKKGKFHTFKPISNLRCNNTSSK